jgi:hypothetical protein
MGFSPYLGRDGLLHTFTYIKVHTARIYEVSRSQTAPADMAIRLSAYRVPLPIPAHAQHDWQQRRRDARRAA